MGPVIHMSNSSSEGNRYTLASHEFKLAQKKSSYWSGVQEQDCLQVCLQLDIDKSIGFSGNLFFFLRDLNPFWDETFQITVDDISAPLDLKVSIILLSFFIMGFHTLSNSFSVIFRGVQIKKLLEAGVRSLCRIRLPEKELWIKRVQNVWEKEGARRQKSWLIATVEATLYATTEPTLNK